MLRGIYILGIIVTFVLFCIHELPETYYESITYLVASIIWPVIIFAYVAVVMIKAIGNALLFLIGFVHALYVGKDR